MSNLGTRVTNNPSSHTTTGSPQIVARRENVPPKLSGKNTHRTSHALRFCDAAHWDELAAVYLRQYELPSWDAPCEPEVMRRWLDRLDMTEKEYRQRTNTDLAALNQTQPLRAWIGTVLELIHERRRG